MLCVTVAAAAATPLIGGATVKCSCLKGLRVSADGFPSFLPDQVERIRDPFARNLAKRVERLPVQMSFMESPVMSSCVKPLMQSDTNPVILLHGFDGSCLEWRCAYPLLEEAGLETWAVDILGWGFCDLESLPSCDVVSKREHLFQFWKSYIKKPMILVGPSLGAAVAIDFAVNHSEAVAKLVLIDASVYSEGTGMLAKLPRTVAYLGVSLLKSTPLRLYANFLAFNNVSVATRVDWTNVGRLHCLLPWWKDATVDFMFSGGYNVCNLIGKVKQETLIIWGEDDQIISNMQAEQPKNRLISIKILGYSAQYVECLDSSKQMDSRLQSELPNAILQQIPRCGHLPHVEKPNCVVRLIKEFV